MRSTRYVIFSFIVFLIMNGCDTKSVIDDPNKSYFIKFYGGDGDQTGDDLVALPDGSFILFGTTRPTGKASKWYLVKTDAKGNVVWEKTFGGKNDAEARDIELANNNTLVAVGNYSNSSTDRDIMIMTFSFDGVKIDSAVVSVKFIANPQPLKDDDAVSVSLTSNGFIVAGSTANTSIKPNAVVNDQRDAFHMRFFNDLTVYPDTWHITDGPGTFDAAVKVIQVSSAPDQFYTFGYSNLFAAGHSSADYNYWVYSIGPNGDANTADLHIGASDDEKLSSVSITPLQSGDGYFLGGITYTSLGASDIYIAKLRKTLSFDQSDNQFQSKPLSIKLGDNLPPKAAVFASQQSGFYILTNENNFNVNQNWLLTKVNNDGSPAWTLPIDFGGEGTDTCGAVQDLPDGRIVLIGTMTTGKPDGGEKKMTLIKISQDGKLSN